MPFATVGGVRLHYAVRGEAGAWITLVHGGLVHSGSWERQVDALTSVARVLTYDVRGYGKSDRPPTGYNIPAFASDLLGLWDALGIEQSHLLGFSMGGFIAQQTALYAPHRVTSLILVSTASQLGPQARRIFAERAEVAQQSGLDQEAGIHIKRAFSPAFRKDRPAFVAQYSEEILRNDQEVVARTFHGLRDFDCSNRLDEIHMPTLILAGEFDEAIPNSSAIQLHQSIPGSRLVLLPLGHTIHLEEPQVFNSLICEFLNGCGSD